MKKKTKEVKKIKLDGGQLLLTVTDKRQTRPPTREGAQQRQESKIQTESTSSRKLQGRSDAKTHRPTDRPTE
jgi:hypothetical protein